jgi:hypothetical protein
MWNKEKNKKFSNFFKNTFKIKNKQALIYTLTIINNFFFFYYYCYFNSEAIRIVGLILVYNSLMLVSFYDWINYFFT